MKRPTKKQIQSLRIALGMTGAMALNDAACDLILTTQNEVKRLGGKFSLRDGVAIQFAVEETYSKKKGE